MEYITSGFFRGEVFKTSENDFKRFVSAGYISECVVYRIEVGEVIHNECHMRRLIDLLRMAKGPNYFLL